MLSNILVEFCSGRLLSKEMLIELEHKIIQYELFYSGYCDGILSGMELTEENRNIWIGKGIVKHKDKIYFLERKMNIQKIIDMSFCEDGQRCVLVLKEKEVKNSPESIMMHSMEFLVKEVDEVEEDDIWIGEFQYAKGVSRRLFVDDDFKLCMERQLSNVGSVFSVIKQPYSLQGETTFSPFIFDMLRNLLERKVEKSNFDRCFLMNLYQSRVVSKKILLQYLEYYGIFCDYKNDEGILKGYLEIYSSNKNTETMEKRIPKKEISSNSRQKLSRVR